MTDVSQEPVASVRFAQHCRLSISPDLRDALKPRPVKGFFMEPDFKAVETMDDFLLSVSAAEAAGPGSQCVPWEQTTKDMRDSLIPVNPLLEERGLVVALAVFPRGGSQDCLRIYALPAKLFEDGTCVASTTWERMCEAWRAMPVWVRFDLLQSGSLAFGLWEKVQVDGQEVMS